MTAEFSRVNYQERTENNLGRRTCFATKYCLKIMNEGFNCKENLVCYVISNLYRWHQGCRIRGALLPGNFS